MHEGASFELRKNSDVDCPFISEVQSFSDVSHC
jgi:hypothetical protein